MHCKYESILEERHTWRKSQLMYKLLLSNTLLHKMVYCKFQKQRNKLVVLNIGQWCSWKRGCPTKTSKWTRFWHQGQNCLEFVSSFHSFSMTLWPNFHSLFANSIVPLNRGLLHRFWPTSTEGDMTNQGSAPSLQRSHSSYGLPPR